MMCCHIYTMRMTLYIWVALEVAVSIVGSVLHMFRQCLSSTQPTY